MSKQSIQNQNYFGVYKTDHNTRLKSDILLISAKYCDCQHHGGSPRMTAKFANVDDRILDACDISDGSMIARGSSDKQQTGGMHLDCGYLSPYFVTDPERMEVAFENVYILIHEGKISSKTDLLPLLQQITKSGKPLLIIAEDVGGEALATLVVNKLRGTLQAAAVRSPGVGDQRTTMLEDIARLTGGKAITEGLGIHLKNIRISDLGQAKKVTIGKNNTVIEGGVKYDPLWFEPEARIHPIGQTVACAIFAD